jgi:hypothetical protein
MQLYQLCADGHVASWWRSLEQQGELTNPYANTDTATSLSVVARNKAIALTLIESLETYECPTLFVGDGHVGPLDQSLTNPSSHDDLPLERFRERLSPDQIDLLRQGGSRGIADYLRDVGIGYCLMLSRGDPLPNDAVERTQLERYFALFVAQQGGDMGPYWRSFVPSVESSVTVAPAPNAAAQLLQAANKTGKSRTKESSKNKGKPKGKGKSKGKGGNGDTGDGKGGENGQGDEPFMLYDPETGEMRPAEPHPEGGMKWENFTGRSARIRKGLLDLIADSLSYGLGP